MKSQILKQNIKLSLFIGLTSILFTGCATSNNPNGLSGTYDADTFREKHDPDPNVDYSKIKRKKHKKLNVSSGTYDAATFRAFYDPDPNVDYGPILAKTNRSNDRNDINSAAFWSDALAAAMMSASFSASQMSMQRSNFHSGFQSAIGKI